MKNINILLSYLKTSWHFYVMALTLHFIASGINVYYPKVLGQFTDQLQSSGLTMELVLKYSLLLLLIGAGHVVIGGCAHFIIMLVGRRFEKFVRELLFRHFTNMSERFYSTNGVGKLLSYFMNDVTAVRESISMGVNASANATMLLIASITMMVISGIPYYLILASVFPLLLIPLIVVYLGPLIRNRSLQVQEALGEMTESAEEQFGGIRVTKKFAVEDIMVNKFASKVDNIKLNQMLLVKVSSLFQALIPFLGALALVIAITLGGYLTINGSISLGSFVALTLYIRMLMNPLQQIGNVINSIQRSRASLMRLSDLLNQQAEIIERADAIAVSLEQASIELKDVSFAYGPNSQKVLDEISFTLPAGKTLGVIGRTGSGKTTLMKLLLRRYEASSGSIKLAGYDIRQISLKSLQTQIGYVPQDGFLFSSTIRENIAFHCRKAELSKVEAAAKQAHVLQNILQFPRGFETRLGDRGLTLSGGQRQRVSLARGMMKRAPIMILDDSVSAVDTVTEKAIMKSLQQERKGKSTIIIAHRISAVQHADEIIVLDKGRIVERGTHLELLKRNGIYAAIHAIQEEGNRYASDASRS